MYTLIFIVCINNICSESAIATDYKNRKDCIAEGLEKVNKYEKSDFPIFRIKCVLTDFN